jgi:hypothetical protein
MQLHTASCAARAPTRFSYRREAATEIPIHDRAAGFADRAPFRPRYNAGAAPRVVLKMA